jgi:hypothetical protein
MNGTIVGGVAAGVLGVAGGIGIHAMMRDSAKANDVAASREWNDWKARLDEQFPSVAPDGERAFRPLATDADQERFDAFLQANPAPGWLRIEHENLRRVSIDPFEPNVFEDKRVLVGGGLGIGGGLLLALGGAGLSSVRGASPMLRSAGSIASAAGVALALTTVASTFFLPKGETRPQIESTEWSTPSKWYH